MMTTPKFTPLTPEQIEAAENPKLPVPVRHQVDEAIKIQQRQAKYNEMHPRRGRPKRSREYKPVPFIQATSEQKLNSLTALHIDAVGKRTKGNKRIAHSALLADLVAYFSEVKQSGRKLTVSKVLPKRLVTPALIEILRRHEYIKGYTLTDAQRGVIGEHLERHFRRAVNTVK